MLSSIIKQHQSHQQARNEEQGRLDKTRFKILISIFYKFYFREKP